MKPKHWFLLIVAILGVWFLFTQRAILAPFIMAAIFAYVCNPVVNFFSHKLRLPRVAGIAIIYSILLGVVVLAGAVMAQNISRESVDLHNDLQNGLKQASVQISFLPDWLQPFARDTLITFRKSRFISIFDSTRFIPTFAQVISRVISFFIFLFSGFYFLKDGERSEEHTSELQSPAMISYAVVLLGKINLILIGYLRGQLFLVFLMSCALYIVLSILGVKFALSLAIFSGFAEIVPVIGPITAGAVAALVVLFTGHAYFGLLPLQAALIVILVYFVLRQIEDYFVIPYVIGRITQLPPFIVFFSVVAGGHIAGILGLILAVPIAAIIRLLFTSKILGSE